MTGGSGPGAVITSPRNPRIADVARLRRARNRRATGRTLLEGPHLLDGAVAAGAVVDIVVARSDDRRAAEVARGAGAELLRVGDAVLDRLAPTEHPRGPVAVVRIPDPAPLRRSTALVLWEVADPGNAGTLLRTAHALGHQVVTVPGTVDLWSPKVLRAAAGAHFGGSPPAVIEADLAPLRRAGLTVAAAVARGGVPPADLPEGPVALLIGNEAHGLPPDVADAADVRVTVPLRRAVESLNAAAAGAILLWELSRR